MIFALEDEFIRIQAEAQQLNQGAATNYVRLLEVESDMLDHSRLPIEEYAARQFEGLQKIVNLQSRPGQRMTICTLEQAQQILRVMHENKREFKMIEIPDILDDLPTATLWETL